MDALVATARGIGFETSGAEPQYHSHENLVGWRLALTLP